MPRYTNESAAGRARVKTYGADRTEREVNNAPNSEMPLVQKVDPSVRLGGLRGDIMGNVPLERQMRKPEAYKAKNGSA